MNAGSPGPYLAPVGGDMVFAVTPRGRDELSQGETGLDAAQLELLVRIDGRSTLARIRQAMDSLAPAAFDQALRHLRQRGFVDVVQDDPFDLQMQADLDRLSNAIGDDDADATVRSLNASGFFVDIARQRRRASPPPSALSVLMVEDDPFLARFVQSFLTFDGASVRIAANRAEVVAQMNQRPLPDVILLDVALPDVNGFEILRRIRQHRTLCDIPVLMLTGAATRRDVIRGLTDGADGYVTKPFRPESLSRAVRTVLGLPSPSQAGDLWTNPDAKAPRP